MTYVSGCLAGSAAAWRRPSDDPAALIEDALGDLERPREAIRRADEDVPPR